MIKTERTQIHFLSDVVVAFVSLVHTGKLLKLSSLIQASHAVCFITETGIDLGAAKPHL